MKNILLFLLVSIAFSSCGSSKKAISKSRSSHHKVSKNSNTKIIVKTALSYKGTKYKYGGTTKKGMDCSGLVYTSFKKGEVVLPRTSRAMSTQGTKISLKKVAIGDLLFFKTNKRKNVINHVGLVVSIGKRIEFIHASTSKGVTISSLDERYWNNCFAGVRRIL